MKIKWLPFIFMLPLFVGCGTVTTLVNSDEEIARKLRIKKTNCDELSRLYSGFSYNMCILNSDRTGIVFPPMALIFIADSLVSIIADTLVLPYTGYQQHLYGDRQL